MDFKAYNEKIILPYFLKINLNFANFKKSACYDTHSKYCHHCPR